MRTIPLIIIIKAFVATAASAQIKAEDIQLAIKAGQVENALQFSEDVKVFYRSNGYNYVWVNNSSNTQSLLQLLKNAAMLGLQEEDYQFGFIQSAQHNRFIPPTSQDSLFAEIRFTDAAVHFFRDVAYGSHKPAMGYTGLNYIPDCYNIPALMATAMSGNRLPELVKDLEPRLTGYATLKDWLAILNQSIADSTFKEQKITAAAVNNRNEPLLNRLYYLGIIDSLHAKYTDAEVKKYVRSAQRLFNLTDDGLLNKLTLDGLNVPLSIRIKELAEA